VPTIFLVRLTKSRVKGTNQVAEGHTPHTLHSPLLGAVEDPGVLGGIPEQCCLAVLLLSLCASQWSTEGANELPFVATTRTHYLLSIL